jgi:hypothetical protein
MLKNSPEDDKNGILELVDVGGGHGAVLRKILEAHPNLVARKCMLQDRPDVIKMAKDNGLLPPGARYLAHDFMQEQPIKGFDCPSYGTYAADHLMGIEEPRLISCE